MSRSASKHASTRHIVSKPNAGGDRLANLAAASTFYVSPSQELLFYATEHDNDGPSGTVKAGEWRHVDMVRPGSPTLKPTLTVNGPFDIDEGSVATVTATAKPPVTKAWMQLYTEQDYKGTYVVVDYDDYVLDNYNYLAAFETPFSFYERIRSWRWYAPLFCNAQAIADDIFSTSDVPFLRTLAGLGAVYGNSDLTLITDDSGMVAMDRRTSGVDFLADCDAYYHTPFDVRWDRNDDGSSETAGSAIEFDATAIDGPAAFSIPLQATHPVGGLPLNARAAVTVRNVAPAIAGFKITNSAGQQIGVDVMFALVKTPLTVTASFTDPGRADTQTARVSWGTPSWRTRRSSRCSHKRPAATPAPSRTRTVTWQAATTRWSFRSRTRTLVKTWSRRPCACSRPAQALTEILQLLDAAIASAPNPAARGALVKARLELVGRERARWRAADARCKSAGRRRRVRPAGNRPASERPIARSARRPADHHAAAGVCEPDGGVTWSAALEQRHAAAVGGIAVTDARAVAAAHPARHRAAPRAAAGARRIVPGRVRENLQLARAVHAAGLPRVPQLIWTAHPRPKNHVPLTTSAGRNVPFVNGKGLSAVGYASHDRP